MKKKKASEHTCNQCSNQMKNYILVGESKLYFCKKLECPNYGLLQIANENMSDDRD